MPKPLSKKLRAQWDALIAGEGAALGLSDCHAFLENKYVNDVFYEGFFKGRPCVVKCSSRAPDSIRNEYEMARRLYAEAPVCAEPLACFCTPDGKMAFVVTEKLNQATAPEHPADDILRLAEALHRTGIVHRDVSIDNLLVDGDGRLRLIDFQFAIDRNCHRECTYMKSHPKYLYVVFGNCEELGLGRWNDLLGKGLIQALRHFAPTAYDAETRLRNMIPEMEFAARISAKDSVCIGFYFLSLTVQRIFHKHEATSCRWRKLYKLLAGRLSFVTSALRRGPSVAGALPCGGKQDR